MSARYLPVALIDRDDKFSFNDWGPRYTVVATGREGFLTPFCVWVEGRIAPFRFQSDDSEVLVYYR